MVDALVVSDHFDCQDPRNKGLAPLRFGSLTLLKEGKMKEAQAATNQFDNNTKKYPFRTQPPQATLQGCNSPDFCRSVTRSVVELRWNSDGEYGPFPSASFGPFWPHSSQTQDHPLPPSFSPSCHFFPSSRRKLEHDLVYN
jgi:hypothetical protein